MDMRLQEKSFIPGALSVWDGSHFIRLPRTERGDEEVRLSFAAILLFSCHLGFAYLKQMLSQSVV